VLNRGKSPHYRWSWVDMGLRGCNVCLIKIRLMTFFYDQFE